MEDFANNDEDMQELQKQLENQKLLEIQRELGYGISENVFADKFNQLDKTNQERLKRVAERLKTINTLSYESVFLENPYGNPFFERSELRSIQMYLYCTCIDTLAGEPDFKDFYNWIRQKDDLSKSNIDKYHEEYLKQYGNWRNFKKLFGNLIPKISGWLNENVAFKLAFYEKKSPNKIPEIDILLARYFYNYWRNPFTHQSVTRQFNVFDENWRSQHLPDNQKQWDYDEFILEDKDDEWRWCLWYKKELDVRIIARLIIHLFIFQQLEIPITDELINKNVYFLQRLHWIYKYIHEIRKNENQIRQWTKVEGEQIHQFLPGLRSSGYVHLLHSEAANKMLEFFVANNALENDLPYIREYVNYVNEANNLIYNFNIEFHNQTEEIGREEEMRDFLLNLTKQLFYSAIEKHHSLFLYSSMWLLIRENYWYESK